MSELAQDDDTLTARLVNNEAMYLRREEPPSNIERERTILLDTTIQLWGLPRVFALAAALACAEKKQHISRIQAFALRGEDCEILDLTTKKGVVEALGQLDFHWHCGVALRDFLLNTRSSATHDIVFVTDAETLKTPDFQPFIAEAKRFLTYLIVVNRVGALQVFDLSGGRNKSLGNATFDLADLLFPTKKPRKKNATDELFTPLFYDQKPLPLFYLPTGALLRRMRVLQHPSVGVVNITNMQRVLRWRTPESGAEELLPVIEDGEYCMGFGNISMLYIVVSNEVTRLFKFYKIDIRNGHVESHDFTGKTFATVDEMAYYQSHFHLKNGKILDCREATMSSEAIDFDPIFRHYTQEKEAISLKWVKQFIKNRNSPLLNPTAIFINTRNELIIDKFSIQMKNNDALIFRETTVERHTVEEGTEGSLTVSTPFDNPSVLFFEKKWHDGSVAAVDSRGFLHLKSSNPTLPEITIIPNLGDKVTAWASDGKYCGNPYYLSVRNGSQVPVVYFFKTYIQRFIHHILDV